MANKYLLGIDVGTTRIKAVLFNIHGRQVFSSSRDTRLIKSGSCSEVDMDELWEDVAGTIKSVILKMGPGSKILAAAVSGQGEGLWLIDKDGKPIGRAILWNDSRAESLVTELENNSPISESIFKITGSPLFPGATSVLLRWLKDNKPEQIAKAHNLMFCKDWIRYKLTNLISTDTTDASTSLLNLETGTTSVELFDHLKIKNLFPLIPKLFTPSEYSGTVTKFSTNITGLPIGTPIACGAFDVAATALGCGAIKDGDACVILGTSGCSIVVSDILKKGPNDRSGMEMHAVPELFIKVSATMAATPNIDWVYDLFNYDKNFNNIEAELGKIPAGSYGLIYHPYISLSGERAPFYSPGASAQFSGINEKTTPLTMTRAVYEGVALSIKDCLKNQDPERIFLAGGGARSLFWAKIISNCTNLPVFISTETELCARGSALMAGIAGEIYVDIDHAINHINKPRRIDPEPDQVAIYDELFNKYVQIQKKMMSVWNS